MRSTYIHSHVGDRDTFLATVLVVAVSLVLSYSHNRYARALALSEQSYSFLAKLEYCLSSQVRNDKMKSSQATHEHTSLSGITTMRFSSYGMFLILSALLSLSDVLASSTGSNLLDQAAKVQEHFEKMVALAEQFNQAVAAARAKYNPEEFEARRKEVLERLEKADPAENKETP